MKRKGGFGKKIGITAVSAGLGYLGGKLGAKKNTGERLKKRADQDNKI